MIVITKIVKFFMLISSLLDALFKIRIVRYILLIITTLYIGKNEGKLKAYMHIYDDSQEIVKEVAKQPKNTVKNVISEVKVKDNSKLDFSPKNEIQDNDIINDVIDSQPKEIEELSKKEIRKKRRKERREKRKNKRNKKDR